MRVPLNWLNEYVELPKKLGDLTTQLTMAGHMLDKFEENDGKPVLDLELRGNRADCYSILGIAREVSALFNTPTKYPKTNHPLKKVKQLKQVELKVETELVKRVMMTTIKNIKIIPSPKWLKEKLEAYGMQSINNIVDLTNFVMVETGQPMHAFDLEKIGGQLEIRLAKNKEKMTTFLGKTVSLTSQDLVWSNKGSILSVAGAIGGKNHSISETTKNVLLEAANYDRANIRRSIHKHNLFTDAGIRHEKDLDPNLVESGVYRFLKLIEENEWGSIDSEVFDYYPNPVKPQKLKLTYSYLDELSGTVIDRTKVENILESLNFEVLHNTNTEIEVLVPTYRTDVTLEEDIIEEVLRIYGYDNIPTQTLSLEIPEDVTPSYIKQETKVRESLVNIGFDEIISLPFVLEKNASINKSIYKTNEVPVRITNRPSHDLEELRISMYPNLLEYTKKVINERGEESRIFEIGKVYSKKAARYIEKRTVGIMCWNKAHLQFALFKGYLESFFESLNIRNIRYHVGVLENSILKNSFDIALDGKLLGVGGQFEDIFFAQIELDTILDKSKSPKAILWPKYPPQIEDFTLAIPDGTRVGDIVEIIKAVEGVSSIKLITIYGDSYTFRIEYSSDVKTLSSSEVSLIRKQIISSIKASSSVRIKE